jgi:hypothetical protein
VGASGTLEGEGELGAAGDTWQAQENTTMTAVVHVQFALGESIRLFLLPIPERYRL